MEPQSESQRKRLLLNKIGSRAEKLLRASPNPSQEMSWAENRLFEANLFQGNPPKPRDPATWAEQVILQNPDLMDQSAPYLLEREVRPDRAKTFESLILQLIPTEGGL